MAASAFDECSELLRTRPAARESALCLFEAARAEEDGEGPATTLLGNYSAERRDLPWFSFYLGNLYWLRTQPAAAEAEYLRAAEGFQGAGNDKGEVFARKNRYELLTRLGRIEEAAAEVGRVLEVTENSEDAALRALGRITLARNLLHQAEDLGRAYELLREVEIPASAEDASSLLKERWSRLGEVCMVIGRFGEASDAYRSLVKLAEEIGDPYLEAEARYSLAWVAYERLREAPTAPLRDRTLALAREALSVGSEAGHSLVQARAAWMLGVLTPGDLGARYLEHCHQVTRDASIRSHCLNYLASRQATTDPEAALRLLQRSSDLADQSGDSWAKVHVWQARLQAVWVAEPSEEALAASWLALDAIESLRDRQPRGSQAQAGLFSIWSDDYAWLAGWLLEEAGRGLERERSIAEAFRVSERMRARALADWLRRAVSEPGGAEAIAFRSLAEIRSSLGPEEALLSFQVARWQDLAGDFGGGSWVLAVARDGVTVHRLRGRVEVRRAVQLFDGLIERRDGAEARVAARLYQQLLGEALAALPPEVDRLILVPDDALHRLPFAALRASADAEPLGARYEIVQVPSATLWLDWRRARTAAPGRPILVLADPEPPAADPAAGPGETAPHPVEMQVAQVRDAPRGLGRLPHARREGRAAVRAFGDGLLLIGAEASEAALLALPLRDFGLVHFAAHAVTDEDRPERSAVLLAAGGESDGLLQSAEIAGLDLAGRTVVLASCRSASGSVLRGEGVMSLGRAFFQAGAHGVVASLWPLRDDESAALFDRFYRRLADGASVGEALQGARREAIAAGEPAAAWAGLVVLGDGSLVPVPGGRRSGLDGGLWWLAICSVLLLGAAAGGAAMWRFRRKRS